MVGNDRPCLAALIVPNHRIVERLGQEGSGLPTFPDGEAHPTSKRRAAVCRANCRPAGAAAALRAGEAFRLSGPRLHDRGRALDPETELARDVLNREFSAGDCRPLRWRRRGGRLSTQEVPPSESGDDNHAIRFDAADGLLLCAPCPGCFGQPPEHGRIDAARRIPRRSPMPPTSGRSSTRPATTGRKRSSFGSPRRHG